MTDDQHAAYMAYLRAIADLLGLRDWQIVLERGSAEEGARARVFIHRTKDEAMVQFSEMWWSFDREQQRQTIVHELLHAHTGRLCRVVTRLSGLATDHLEYVLDAHDEEEEIVVQRLSRIIAPFMPLPPEIG